MNWGINGENDCVSGVLPLSNSAPHEVELVSELTGLPWGDV